MCTKQFYCSTVVYSNYRHIAVEVQSNYKDLELEFWLHSCIIVLSHCRYKMYVMYVDTLQF